MPFPSSWSQARLVCIPKEDGGTRPLTVLLVVYRMWASRAARILAEWCIPWFPPQLIGGLRGSPPASATANLVSAYLASAYKKEFLAGACLDTVKCFDSISLYSLELLCRACHAPQFLLNILRLWHSLQRHVWTPDGPTGVVIHLPRQKGIPQGDPVAPWALNLVMAAWIRGLPSLTLCRVYLDDRCLLDTRVARLSCALDYTSIFDATFGMQVHPQKSCRFYTWHTNEAFQGSWCNLPLKVTLKYLGVQLETTANSPYMIGAARTAVLTAKIERARLLPDPNVRRALLASYMSGLYAEGVGITVSTARKLTTAVCQAWWGPTLHPRNHMRSVAITLGLLGPLHRLAPTIVQCYNIFLAMSRLPLWILTDLHEVCTQARTAALGIARLIR